MGKVATDVIFLALFCTNCMGRAGRSRGQVQILWVAWHFLRCDEIWRKPRTKHRFGGSTFSASCENLLENVNFVSYNLSKLKDILHEMLVLVLFHICHCVSLAAPCLWGKLQNLSFEKVSKCQNWRKSRTKCSF